MLKRKGRELKKHYKYLTFFYHLNGFSLISDADAQGDWGNVDAEKALLKFFMTF